MTVVLDSLERTCVRAVALDYSCLHALLLCCFRIITMVAILQPRQIFALPMLWNLLYKEYNKVRSPFMP